MPLTQYKRTGVKMKLSYTITIKPEHIGRDHYFLVMPDFSFKNRTETELANAKMFIEKAESSLYHMILSIESDESRQIDEDINVIISNLDKMNFSQIKEQFGNEIAEYHQKILEMKQKFNHVLTNPKYLLEEMVEEHLMFEIGDKWALFNTFLEAIKWIEQDWNVTYQIWIKRKTESGRYSVFPKEIEKTMKMPIKRIIIMDEETSKPIGTFSYRWEREIGND